MLSLERCVSLYKCVNRVISKTLLKMRQFLLRSASIQSRSGFQRCAHTYIPILARVRSAAGVRSPMASESPCNTPACTNAEFLSSWSRQGRASREVPYLLSTAMHSSASRKVPYLLQQAMHSSVRKISAGTEDYVQVSIVRMHVSADEV